MGIARSNRKRGEERRSECRRRMYLSADRCMSTACYQPIRSKRSFGMRLQREPADGSPDHLRVVGHRFQSSTLYSCRQAAPFRRSPGPAHPRSRRRRAVKAQSLGQLHGGRNVLFDPGGLHVLAQLRDIGRSPRPRSTEASSARPSSPIIAQSSYLPCLRVAAAFAVTPIRLRECIHDRRGDVGIVFDQSPHPGLTRRKGQL